MRKSLGKLYEVVGSVGKGGMDVGGRYCGGIGLQ